MAIDSSNCSDGNSSQSPDNGDLPMLKTSPAITIFSHVFKSFAAISALLFVFILIYSNNSLLKRDEILFDQYHSEQFAIISTAFENSGLLPLNYTCGANNFTAKGVSPPLSWSNEPFGTKEFLITMQSGNSYDWVLYEIPRLVFTSCRFSFVWRILTCHYKKFYF